MGNGRAARFDAVGMGDGRYPASSQQETGSGKRLGLALPVWGCGEGKRPSPNT
jgi:hypothetical protein